MANTVRFIHAADIHLGRQFARAGAVEGAVGSRLQTATYDALRAVVDQAISQRVDFVILAGDTIDSDELNLKARAFLNDQLAKLGGAGIAVYMVHGNHDPANAASTGGAPMPPNVTVFPSDRVEEISAVTERGGSYTIYGRSYPTQAVADPSFVGGYRRRAGAPNAIGVLHANVGGQPGHDNYAPASLGDLVSGDMDYWALGHIHLEAVLRSERPVVVYPGSTQALQINETGRHGCYLVELSDGVPSLTWLPTGAVGVRHVEIDLTGVASVVDVPALAASAAVAALGQAAEGSLLVRLVLSGVRDFAQPLGGEVMGELVEAARDALIGSSANIWITDKVIDRSRRNLTDEMVQSANPFIRAILTDGAALNLADALREGTDRLGRGARANAPGVSTVVPDILETLTAKQDDILAAARELAYAHLMGGEE